MPVGPVGGWNGPPLPGETCSNEGQPQCNARILPHLLVTRKRNHNQGLQYHECEAGHWCYFRYDLPRIFGGRPRHASLPPPGAQAREISPAEQEWLDANPHLWRLCEGDECHNDRNQLCRHNMCKSCCNSFYTDCPRHRKRRVTLTSSADDDVFGVVILPSSTHSPASSASYVPGSSQGSSSSSATASSSAISSAVSTSLASTSSSRSSLSLAALRSLASSDANLLSPTAITYSSLSLGRTRTTASSSSAITTAAVEDSFIEGIVHLWISSHTIPWTFHVVVPATQQMFCLADLATMGLLNKTLALMFAHPAAKFELYHLDTVCWQPHLIDSPLPIWEGGIYMLRAQRDPSHYMGTFQRWDEVFLPAVLAWESRPEYAVKPGRALALGKKTLGKRRRLPESITYDTDIIDLTEDDDAVSRPKKKLYHGEGTPAVPLELAEDSDSDIEVIAVIKKTSK